MKGIFVRLSISCALSLSAFQAYGDVPTLGPSKPRDCSQISDAAKKARCEEINKAMAACQGKKAGDELTNCLREQHKKK